MNKLFDIIIKNIDRIKSKINDIELEKQELSGNIIENKNKRLNLSETFDISRIRYDYGIKLKNDNLVRMNSKLLEIDTDGNLYFLNVNNPKEKEIIGKVENCLYEFDIFDEEWKKADIVRILSSTNFAIKGSKLKELSKAILHSSNVFSSDKYGLFKSSLYLFKSSTISLSLTSIISLPSTSFFIFSNSYNNFSKYSSLLFFIRVNNVFSSI